MFVWAHGWGANRTVFLPIIESIRNFGSHILIDFPGFGETPAPSSDWGTLDYADATATFLKEQFPNKTFIWVGHSFGCRVGVQIGAKYPELFEKMLFIAGAGLPRKRSLAGAVKVKGKIYTYKALKKVAPLIGLSTEALRDRFGSADYKSAGNMRNILTKVVREDLSDVAEKISCPVKLIYGSDDVDTPPEIGERYARLIKTSEFVLINGEDHNSILDKGRHQVVKHIKQFIS